MFIRANVSCLSALFYLAMKSSCLQATDLDAEEWERFADGIARIAEQREKHPDDFRTFKVCSAHIHVYLVAHGPLSLSLQSFPFTRFAMAVPLVIAVGCRLKCMEMASRC